MGELPEYLDGLPNLCGSEQTVEAAIAAGRDRPVFDGRSSVGIAGIDSVFAVALHMHQPLIPAGGGDLRTAAIISNLEYMMEHPERAATTTTPRSFHWCYRRMGEFIPQLVAEGKQPRVMLDYSGMPAARAAPRWARRRDRRPATADLRPAYLRAASNGSAPPWGHAVAPSTPGADFRLHVRAWQHHFAADLRHRRRWAGCAASRPPEMALPNHPDVAYEFVKTLKECGYRWVLVQEHTVELPDGRRRWSARTMPAPAGLPATRAARSVASSPSSRRRAATPSWSPRCSRTTRPRACPALELAGRSGAAAGHADRRRRERRRHDERVPAQVPRGRARGSGSDARRC